MSWSDLTTDQKIDEMHFMQLAVSATTVGLALLGLGFALYRASEGNEQEKRIFAVERELARLAAQGDDLTAIARLDRLEFERA